MKNESCRRTTKEKEMEESVISRFVTSNVSGQCVQIRPSAHMAEE